MAAVIVAGMARTPGRRTDEPDEDGNLAPVDELTYFEVGIELRELAKQLNDVSSFIDDPKFKRELDEVQKHGSAQHFEDLETEFPDRLRRTLMGMRSFRRNYDYWERVIAEFALRDGFTQRDTARLLGVSTATINRWNQHPVSTEQPD